MSRARNGSGATELLEVIPPIDGGNGKAVIPQLDEMLRLDKRIDASEVESIRDRWEFGWMMVKARNGAKRLPNGFMEQLIERTGKSKTELSDRAQFAERYPTEDELSNALDSFASWFDVTQHLAPRAGRKPPPPKDETCFWGGTVRSDTGAPVHLPLPVPETPPPAMPEPTEPARTRYG
jgi:hypothetical protein